MPALVDPPSMTAGAARTFVWFNAAALGTWLACGLWPIASIASGRLTGGPAAFYVTAFVIFGVALVAILRLPHRAGRPHRWIPMMLAGVQAASGIAANLVTAWNLQGTGIGIGLLVIVAAQLPYFLTSRMTWSWIVVQTAALFGAAGSLAPGSAIAGITTLLATLAFQVFAAACSILAISEGQSRERLARTNAELTAARELLAESSRTAERLRIARDLHDTLGHHLAALSLQLDVASRLSDPRAAGHVQQAHAITKLLLGDVRDAVSTLRETRRLDLGEAVRALIAQPLAARVHLDIAGALAVDDAARAEALLRAVQEVLTNTARHARAANLWIRLASSAEGITLTARDDGRGAAGLIWGNGLKGMRERFEQCGGRIEAGAAPGGGFEIRGFMPAAAPPA